MVQYPIVIPAHILKLYLSIRAPAVRQARALLEDERIRRFQEVQAALEAKARIERRKQQDRLEAQLKEARSASVALPEKQNHETLCRVRQCDVAKLVQHQAVNENLPSVVAGFRSASAPCGPQGIPVPEPTGNSTYQ